MATRIAPPSDASAPPPFLLSPVSESSFHGDFADALKAAIIAEARAQGRRHERCRIAHLLCELSFQLRRMRGSHGDTVEIPIARGELAAMLGVSLVRVKRALALLALSQVISTDGSSIRVLDWRRLCGVASYDPGRLGLKAEEDDILTIVAEDEEAPRNLVTAAGDPACFV
jgi:Crp-like helix-turn-helix domain